MLGRVLLTIFIAFIPALTWAQSAQARPELVVVDHSKVLSLDAGSKPRNIVRRVPLFSALSADVAASSSDIVVTKEWRELEQEMCAEYEDSDCSLNYRFSISETPDDGYYSQLAGMTKISAPTAWNTTVGSSDIVVAVIDTGVDYNHPDLAANMWVNSGEIAGNHIDDDANGYVDDVHGYDFVNDDGDPMDDQSHGTHVSGTIGAVGDNGLGVVGVNWNVKIMAVKFLNSVGSGYLSDAVSAIEYVKKMRESGEGIVVANNSWGSSGSSNVIKTALEELEAAGVVAVSAAGNSGVDNDSSSHIPSDNSTISVAATDSDDSLASFSNYGATKVDLAAPGVSILSTVPGASYAKYSGTSMATPHVSGAIALVAAAFPGYTVQQLKNAIFNNVTYLDGLYGKVLTGGRLNVGAAVAYGEDRGVVDPIYAVNSVIGTPKWYKKIVLGKYFKIKFRNENYGDGVGTLNIALSLDGYSCGSVKTLSIPAGSEVVGLRARLPSVLSAATLTIGAQDGATISKKIFQSKGSKLSKVSLHSNSLTAQDYSDFCGDIGNSITLQSLK